MLHNFLTAFVVTAYWLTYVFIGMGAVLAVRRWSVVSWAQAVATFVADSPVLVQFLLLTGIGWAIMAPWVFVGYVLSLSVVWLIASYLLMLGLSVGIVVVMRREVWRYGVKTYRSMQRELLLAMFVIAATVLLVAAFSYHLGSFLADGTDSFVHMAKINQIAYGRFTLADPFLNGTIESRYHVNIFHALYALPVRLGSLPVYIVWRQSLIFFGILAYASLYAVTWYFMPKSWRRGYPALVATVALLAAAAFWRSANYPNEVVLSWIAIYLLGLGWFLKGKNPVLLFVGTLLAALTHPSYSLMVFAYSLLLGTVLFVLRRPLGVRLGRREGVVAAVVCGTALLPVALSFVFPDRMTGASFNFASGGLLSIQQYGPFKVMALPIVLSHSFGALALMSFGLVGLVWLILKTADRTQRLVIVTLALFYALVAYNPLFITLFSKQLPPWLLQRFSYFDRLSAVTTVLGVLVALVWLCRRIKSEQWRFAVVTVLVLGVFTPTIITQTRILQSEDATQLTLLRSLTQLDSSLNGQTVFASSGLSFMVPSAAPEAHVIWMPETNASPVANMALRKTCGQALQTFLRESDLRHANVTRVLVGVWEPDLNRLAKEKPYLHLLATNENFLVYQVVGSNPGRANTACAIPKGE